MKEIMKPINIFKNFVITSNGSDINETRDSRLLWGKPWRPITYFCKKNCKESKIIIEI